MKKKKWIVLILICLMGVFMIGCSHVEDTNGDDDFTILTFTDRDITKTSVSHLALGLVKTNNKISVKKLSGIYTLSTNNVENETLVYNLASSCTEGNFRIVIVKEGIIVKDIPINSAEIVMLENADGKYILRLVGESAKFSINYTIETN